MSYRRGSSYRPGGGLPAWLRFYRNSLDKLEHGTTPFAAIHTWAAGQVQGRRRAEIVIDDVSGRRAGTYSDVISISVTAQ